LNHGAANEGEGATTSYTYYDTGRIHTATTTLTPRAGVTITTVSTYTYDAAGNVIKTEVDGERTSESPLHVESSAKYDVQGRVVSYTDEVGRTTSYSYTPSSGGMTVATTYPDSTTRIEQYRLDGSLASVSGTAVYGETHDHGVGGTGANDPGDTWTLDAVNNGANTTKTFFNHAGQVYRIEKSAPSTAPGSGTSVATNDYDGNGRLKKSVGFDGTVTLYFYDAKEGSADVVLDMNRDNAYTPLVDRKTITRFDGSTTIGKDLADAGVTTSTSSVGNNGLSATANVNGVTASSQTVFNSDGTVTTTLTNADGTKVVDVSKHGLLLSEKNLGTDGTTVVTQQSFDYDALGRLSKVTDPAWGDTLYERRADGTVSKITYPDGRTTVYADFDDKTNAPKATTRTDGKDQGQTLNDQGQTLTQTGVGIITSKFGYHADTGQATDLTIYRSGELNGAGAEHTGWQYDDPTGLLLSKTYDDDSQDLYSYNAGFQQVGLTRPGQSATFAYNNAGELNSTTYADPTHGNLSNNIIARDDKGRAILSQQVTAGHTVTDVLAYTNLDQLKLDLSGPSGAGTIYEYYPNFGTGSNTGGAAPGALKSVTLKKGDTILEQKVFAYDGVSKRPASITLKIPGQTDQVFSYDYKSGTNLIESVSGGGVTTGLTYEEHTGRLLTINVNDGGENTYFNEELGGVDENFQPLAGYNNNDQRKTEHITYIDANGDPVSYTASYGYDTEDPNNDHPIDALTSVTRTYTAGGLSNESYSYAYDGVGNITDNNGAANTFNNLNQDTAFTYDARGNRTADADRTYTWDALNHLASVTIPNQDRRVEFTYDPSGRRVEKRIWMLGGESEVLLETRGYAWDGDAIAAEFDGQNHLLTTYTWGIGGLAGGLLAVTDHRDVETIKTYRVLTDATGSVVGLVDGATGQVAATYRYDPYGNLLAAEGPAAAVCNYRFAGGFADTETGLQYHLNRYYDPRSGTWLSRDPIAEQGGVNLYEYSGNDPINASDPSGLTSRVTNAQIWMEAFRETVWSNEEGFGELQRQAVEAGGSRETFERFFNDCSAFRTLATARFNDKRRWYHWHGFHFGEDDGPPNLVQGVVDTINAKAADPQGFEAGQAVGMADGAAKMVQIVPDVYDSAHRSQFRFMKKMGIVPNDADEELYLTGNLANFGTLRERAKAGLVDQMLASGIGQNRDSILAGADLGNIQFTFLTIVLPFARGSMLTDIAGVAAARAPGGVLAASSTVGSVAARQAMVAARVARHTLLRSRVADLLRGARVSGLTRARINGLRRLGEQMGWAEEELMVRMTGAGTRPWSAGEMAELLANGRVGGFTAHHINSVGGSPWIAGNARNIEIVSSRLGPGARFTEHQLRHINPMTGLPDTTYPLIGLPFIDRSRMIIQHSVGR
jgi:RHS repeat-associated protein